MEISTRGISTTKAAKRLDVTPATVRRWCETSGFGIRLMGRWRIPENRIAEIERNLSETERLGMPPCRASRS